MARYSSYNTRGPQNACSGRKVQDVVRQIGHMRDKQIRLAKQEFTHDELLDLFVEPQHHAALRYAYDLVEPSGMTSTLWVETNMPAHIAQHARGGKPAHMKFSWYGKQAGGFHVPCEMGSEERYAVKPLFGVADERNIAKYLQVEEDLLDIHCRFALCERVFRNLNDTSVCKTLPQMRYVWPAIQVLLKKAGYHEDAAALAEPSARAGDKVVVPPEYAKYLKETNDTIVRALMLDDVVADNNDDTWAATYYLEEHFGIT